MDDKYTTYQNRGRRIALRILFGLLGLVFGPIGGGVIMILTGVGAAAYVMSQGDSPQRGSSRDRPAVDVATIPTTAHGDVEPTREPTQHAPVNFTTSPVVTATVVDVSANSSLTKPVPMPRPSVKATNTVIAQTAANWEPTVRKVSSTRPADGEMRLALTRDLQRELKRVGCYDGKIDGDWGTGSRMAMKTFTERVNATIPVDEPDDILLALVHGQKDKTCGKCPPGQGFAENGRCLPSTLLAQSAKRALSKRELATTENTRAPAERIKPATTTWADTTPAPSTPAPPIEGRMAVGGPGAAEGTQGEDTSRASHPAHGPGRSFYGAPRSIRPSSSGPPFFAQWKILELFWK